MASFLLKQDGDYLLWQDGGRILLSGSASVPTMLVVELVGEAN